MLCGKGSCGKKQRVSGKKWCEHKARLAKDYDEQEKIGYMSVALDDSAQVCVDVKNKVKKCGECHKRFSIRSEYIKLGNKESI